MADWGIPGKDTCSVELLDAFQRCGRALFYGGLNNSHSGNISQRDGEMYWVTRTRSMCHELSAKDVIKAAVDGTTDRTSLSREAIVHEAIYNATSHQAVVHCHPRHAIALAFVLDGFHPLQIEGYGALPGLVPVLETANASASPELCEKLAPMLRDYPAVMVRGHGLFVGASSIDEATHRACVVDETAFYLTVTMQLGADHAALLKKPYVAAGYRPAVRP
jgi:L-fuculose-phosphate aldolase